MSEDTHRFPNCEACPSVALPPDVTVTIPGELADALVRLGPALIETVRREQAIARRNSEAARIERAREQAAHNRMMDRAGIQAFRLYRRIEAETPDQLERARRLTGLAKRLELMFPAHFSREWVRELIKRRKARVSGYLADRRVRTLVRMYLGGASNGEIAAVLRVTPQSVSRLLKVHRPDIEAARRERAS